MASDSASRGEQRTGRLQETVDRVEHALAPALTPAGRATRFVTSSFFRFLIFLGVVFFGIGAILFEGHVAGHLGIYGVTLAAMGIVGRLIVHWKLKDSS